MARHKDDIATGEAAKAEFVGGGAERAVDAAPDDIAQPVDLIKTDAADDPDRRHRPLSAWPRRRSRRRRSGTKTPAHRCGGACRDWAPPPKTKTSPRHAPSAALWPWSRRQRSRHRR